MDSLNILGTKITKAINMGETCLVMYIDLSAAFDRVWHGTVLQKMVHMSFSGRIIGWMQSFLSDRSFKLWLEEKMSVEIGIKSRVPQGAVLSPVLFNILMSDIVKIYEVQYLEFADDLAIMYAAEDQRQEVAKVQWLRYSKQ